jgi:plastocyanin
MTRAITALIACCALLLASGCGESSEPPKHAKPAAETGSGTSDGEYVPGPTTPAHLPPAGVSVTARDIRFIPESVTLKVGGTVVWMNRDAVQHNVTSVSGPASFSSGNLTEGQGYQFTFTRPGTYRYLCTIHRVQMHGTITVVR